MNMSNESLILSYFYFTNDKENMHDALEESFV